MKRIVLFVSLFCSLTLMAQNPLMLKDVYPGATGSGAGEIVKTGTYTFFTADDEDANQDKGLYRTDGTPGGTIKLDLVYPTYQSTKAEKLIALGDKVIFSGDNFYHYGEVWVSDGTQGGTIALERFQPATPRTNLPTRRVVMDMAALGNSVLYGVKNNDDHLLLKKTDGTPGAMTVVYDFGTFSHPDTDLALFKVINGILYFNLYDVGAGIDQLWRSDGTTAGTYMIKDFGLSQFVASYYMPAGNNFYIMLVTPGTGNVLWKSDGTTAGTLPVKVISDLPYGPVNNNYPSFAALGSTLYFAGLDAAHGKELWKTDGTEAGTVLVSDINAGTASSTPTALTVFNNHLYFAATSAVEGTELWKYDGTTLSLVKDINSGAASSFPSVLTVSNNQLLFRATTPSQGNELWVSDGTSVNTYLLIDLNPGAGNANPGLITPGSSIYFVADNGVSGHELYKYDRSLPVASQTFNSFYVNDNTANGDGYTSAPGSDANNGSASAPFATIGYALLVAQPGDHIYVDAGVYAEKIVIDKAIKLKGRHAGAAPGNALDRGGETVLVPAVNDSTFNNIISVRSGHVVIDGFTIDGDNPSLSGGVSLNGADANAGVGILIQRNQANNVLVRNNIIRNTTRWGVLCQAEAAVALNGIVIENNRVDNLSSRTQSGRALGMFDNAFGTIRNNTITRCNIGVVIANGSLAGVSASVLNNAIETYAAGVEYSSHQTGSGPWTIKDNSITTADFASWASPGAVITSNTNIGMRINYITGNTKLILEGNTITGTYNGIMTFNVVNNAGLTILGGSISNVKNIGLLMSGNNPDNKKQRVENTVFNNNEVANIVSNHTTGTALPIEFSGVTVNGGPLGLALSGNVSLPANALSGIAFNGQTEDYIAMQRNTYENGEIDASSIAFDGLTGAQMSLAQRLAVEDKIHHRIDYNGVGTVRVQAGELYVTPASFWADVNPAFGTATTAPDINRAVKAAVAGDVIHIAAGTYTGQVTIDKGLTLKGAGKGQTIVERGSTGNLVSLFEWSEAGIIQTTSGIGDVYIEDLTVDGSNGTSTLLGPTHGIMLQTSGGIQNSEIRNMRLQTTGSQEGNGLYVTYSGSDPATVSITGNHLHGFTWVGMNIQGNNLSATLANNEVDASGATSGMCITAGVWGSTLSSLDMRHNELKGYNGWGVLLAATSGAVTNNSFMGEEGTKAINNSGAALSATCNWFGTADAEIIYHKIGGPVTYSAWLSDGTDGDAATGFQPLADVCTGRQDKFYVNDNSQAGDRYTTAVGSDANNGLSFAPFATIGKALSVAQAGDMIFVDAGSFVEQVVVDKSITIQGAGADATTIHMPDVMNLNYMSGDIRTYAVIYGFGLEQVTLQGFTVDGGNKNFDGRLFGIALRNTGGEVSHCEIRNFRNKNPYNYTWSAGTPLFVHVANGTTPRSVSLHHNHIHDYYFFGMYLEGAGLSVDVHDNVITGNGVADFAQYGIRLFFGSGQIYNNTISNMVEYTATADVEASAITLYNVANTNVFANRISNCEDGIITNGGSFTIRGNEITGSRLHGIESYAQGTGNATIAIENNSIDNQAYGVFIHNPGTGTVQATVTNNSITNSATAAIVNDNATVAATCNWYGVAGHQEVAALIAGDVTHVPWLVHGADSEPGTTGFQPAANSCTGAYPLQITLDASANSSCFAADNGSADLTISGGLAPYAFAWTKEEDAGYSAATEDIADLAPGTYSLQVSDALGSTATYTITITEPELLVATASGTNVLCNGGSDGAASVEATGGTAPYTYAWSNGSTESELTGLVAGTYSVTVTDANGCTAMGNYTVTQPAPLNGSVDASDITCHGAKDGSVLITARGGVHPYQYALDQDVYGSVNVFDGLAPGTYTARVKDANSCIYIETITITEPELLSVATTSVTGTCAGSSNGSIDVTVSGGTARYSFNWSGPNGFASTREDLSNLAAGTYTLVVTDANNCSESLSVAIVAETGITLDGIIMDASCFGSATGTIDVTVNGGSSPFTYNWSGAKGFKAATEDIAGVPAGAYTVMITSASGCSAQASYTVEQPANALSLSVTKSDIQSCEGKGSLDVVATGGAGLYTYSLNGGTAQSSGSFTDLSAGSYLVTVTDGQGCAVSTTVSIVDNGGDLYEANERQTSAKLINLEEIISARLSARDKDWFKFTASNAFAVHKVSVMRSTNGYLFDLYDSRGKMVTPVGSIDMEKTYRLTAGATYSVQVSGAASLECYQLSVMTDGPVTQARSDGSAKTPETASLQVTAYPNPSAAYFSVLLQGSSGQPVSLRVLDNLGRVVEARSGVAPNTTFTLGSSYRPGIYYLEVQQGAERKTIKLVKQS